MSVLVGLVVLLWSLVTIVTWLFDLSLGRRVTLRRYVCAQWRFIWQAFRLIW